jgi:hypothetical protein
MKVIKYIKHGSLHEEILHDRILLQIVLRSKFVFATFFDSEPDSSVSIATGYGLDSRVSVPGRSKTFFYFTASRPALGRTQPPIQGVP